MPLAGSVSVGAAARAEQGQRHSACQIFRRIVVARPYLQLGSVEPPWPRPCPASTMPVRHRRVLRGPGVEVSAGGWGGGVQRSVTRKLPSAAQRGAPPGHCLRASTDRPSEISDNAKRSEPSLPTGQARRRTQTFPELGGRGQSLWPSGRCRLAGAFTGSGGPWAVSGDVHVEGRTTWRD